MRATATTVVATHRACLAHVPFPGHPERPERLAAAVQGAEAGGAAHIRVPVDEGSVLRALDRVHEPGLAGRLRDACDRAPAIFDSPDNPISDGTYRASVAAVACALAAADAVVRGDASSAFAAARPPGHHATRDRAMGFCFFNNAALAAEALLECGCGPVALVDFDVHHGNGSQAHFWERADVFYLSVHRYPFYPGSGAATEIGSGRGRGFTRNFPLAAGAGDDAYVGALAAGLEELLSTVRPGGWVVSAGFDAHRDDPLGGMDVTDAGFSAIGALLGEARLESPLVAVLEGGYNPEALRRSVRAFVMGLNGVATS